METGQAFVFLSLVIFVYSVICIALFRCAVWLFGRLMAGTKWGAKGWGLAAAAFSACVAAFVVGAGGI